jgi:hypothetical protein
MMRVSVLIALNVFLSHSRSAFVFWPWVVSSWITLPLSVPPLALLLFTLLPPPARTDNDDCDNNTNTDDTESELTAALGTEARRSASAVAQLSEERDLLSRTLHAANQDVAKLRYGLTLMRVHVHDSHSKSWYIVLWTCSRSHAH